MLPSNERFSPLTQSRNLMITQHTKLPDLFIQLSESAILSF